MVRTIIALLLSIIVHATAAPRQPSQPKRGAGGSTYLHDAVRESEHGAGGKRFWLFEPAQPVPKSAPLLLFLHGYSALTPDPYRAWISHLVKRGNIVVYPQYQKDLLTPPPEFLPNSVAAIRHALLVLSEEGRVAPDLKRFAIVGHSAGGVGAAGFAAIAEKEKLPVPRAIMAVHSGQGPEKGWQMIPMEELNTIPKQTRVVVVVGDADKFVGVRSSRKIWNGASHVEERRFITLQTDAHGWPSLSPGHLAPLAQDRFSTNAHDWFGYWRLFDELCDATFSGRAYEPSPEMGEWSDGKAVAPLIIER